MGPRLLPLLLFLSGGAALILEVAWFRRTAQIAGGTAVAMGAVLAAVIGGMALGSLLLGRVADRVRNPLRLYGILELGIALCALLTPFLLDASGAGFTAIQRGLGDQPALATPVRFLFAVLLLAAPAVLMGGSLPAAAAALRAPASKRGTGIGLLYAANTLGAVAGTLAAGFLLLPWLGLTGAMRCAALFSGAAGLVAVALPFTASPKAEPALTAAAPFGESRRAILLYATSGFLGLVAEVAFTRSLVLVFGSTTYAFSAMLAVFLLGIGTGSAIGTRLARSQRGHLRRLETTLALTAALFSISALVVYALPRLYLQGLTGFGWGFETGLVLRFLLAMLALLPGALGLGIAFPLAVHLAGAQAPGEGTGRLYAANTLASIIGSTLAVFLFVPLLGPQYTVAVIALVAAGIAAWSARRPGVYALGLLALIGLLPPSETARERLLAGVYFAPQGYLLGNEIDEKSWGEGVDIPYAAHGRDATVSIWRWYGKSSLLVDGKAVATNQVLADDHHLALLGHLPMQIHPDPQRVLVVGLGMGTTFRAVERHEPSLCRVVEIEEAVVHAAAQLGIEPAEAVVADARSYLKATDEEFDVITSDPIHPWVRGGGDLYTREYLETCKRRLADGGVVCQWLPVYQMGLRDIKDVIRTFCSVYRTAAYFGGGDLVLVGVTESIVPEPALLEIPRDETELEPNLSLLHVAGHEALVRAAGDGPLLTDDALRLEFSAPRQVANPELADCFEWIKALWEFPPPPYGILLDSMEAWARGEADRHRRLLRAALEKAPGHAFTRRYAGESYLGWAGEYVRYNRVDLARQDLEWARHLLENDPRLTGVEADIEAAAGDHGKAALLYSRMLGQTPDSRYLQRKIDALKALE